MRVMRAEDFEKMAKEVVDDYLQHSVPLESGLIRISVNEGLNPDQIQNLVQLANSITHLILFDKKDDGDKIINFEPADPNVVLKKVYKDNPPECASEEESEKPLSDDSVSDFFSDFPDLSKKIQEFAEQNSDTTAPEEISNNPSKPKSTLIIRIRKVAEELKNRELAAAFGYKEELDKLAAEFAKLYGPDYDDFEKDALAVRGKQAIPILRDVRNCLRMPPLRVTNLEKTAHVVDTDTPLMKSLDTLIKLSTQHDENQAAYKYLKQQLGGII